MNYPDDTIAAISTAIGEGGIGIVRLSGKNAIAIADSIFLSPKGKRLKDAKSHSINYGFVVDNKSNEKLDEALFSVMRAPATYTKEDIVEINCHGGMFVVKAVLNLALREGARIADPGEFTRRAFLNGRIDLSQAEAVIDVIRAKTSQAEKLAMQQLEGRLSVVITDSRDKITNICAHVEAYIDFPDEEIEVMERDAIIRGMEDIKNRLSALVKGYDEGKFFRDGVSAAIVGKPNVGKSSILNALLEKDRAIVTDIPGTTRDIIEDYINIKGLPLRIMDTAGIREAHDLAEMEGVKRSLKAIENADIVIAVLDASTPLDEADTELLRKVQDKKTIIAINKCDIKDANPSSIKDNQTFESPEGFTQDLSYLFPSIVEVSALKGDGIEELKDAIYSSCISSDKFTGIEDVTVTNIRHKQSLENALKSLLAAEKSLNHKQPFEIVALSLRESLDHLGEIIGAITTDDILNIIFSEFCIGK